MKFIFSLIVLSSLGRAQEVILITHQNNLQGALSIKKILNEDWGMPLKLIRLRSVINGCTKDNHGAWLHLCLNHQGEIELKSKRDKELEMLLNEFSPVYPLERITL